jgi:hypothetical protein
VCPMCSTGLKKCALGVHSVPRRTGQAQKKFPQSLGFDAPPKVCIKCAHPKKRVQKDLIEHTFANFNCAHLCIRLEKVCTRQPPMRASQLLLLLPALQMPRLFCFSLCSCTAVVSHRQAVAGLLTNPSHPA